MTESVRYYVVRPCRLVQGIKTYVVCRPPWNNRPGRLICHDLVLDIVDYEDPKSEIAALQYSNIAAVVYFNGRPTLTSSAVLFWRDRYYSCVVDDASRESSTGRLLVTDLKLLDRVRDGQKDKAEVSLPVRT